MVIEEPSKKSIPKTVNDILRVRSGKPEKESFRSTIHDLITVNDILRVRSGKPEKESFRSIIYDLIKDELVIDIRIKLKMRLLKPNSITICAKRKYSNSTVSEFTHIQVDRLLPISILEIKKFLTSEGFVRNCGIWIPAHTCE